MKYSYSHCLPDICETDNNFCDGDRGGASFPISPKLLQEEMAMSARPREDQERNNPHESK